MLVRLGRHEEAEQQFQLGLRMLKEVGTTTTGALAAARKRAQTGQPGPEIHAPRPTAQKPAIGLASHLVGRDREAASLVQLFERTTGEGKAHFVLVRAGAGHRQDQADRGRQRAGGRGRRHRPAGERVRVGIDSAVRAVDRRNCIASTPPP